MSFAWILFFLCAGIALNAQTPPSGIVWEDEKYLSLPLKSDFGEKPEYLPPKYSFEAYCPRVVNQTSFATSAVWSTVWYGQTIAEAASCLQSDEEKITENALSPLFPYKVVNPNSGCTTPVKLSEVFESLMSYGAPRFSDFNDLCPQSIPTNVFSLARQNKIHGYAKLFNPFDTYALKINSIKEALSANHPVIIGMIAPPSLALADEFWQPREKADTTHGAQALCIVSYDDQKFGGAVEVVNQWGKNWGKNGFTWIRYADLIGFARYGYELFYTASCFPLPEGSVVIFDDKGRVIEDLPIANKYHFIDQKLKVGSKFRISIRAKTGAFIYFLTKDPSGTTSIFPGPNTHPFVTQSITLPGKDSYYQLEGNRQINQLYLIVSKRQFDPDVIKGYIENGSLFARDTTSNSSFQVNSQFKDDIRLALIEMEQY